MFAITLAVGLVALVSSVSARTCVCVATSGGGEVNIRSCPDTTCTILGAGAAGDCFDYLGANSGVWHNIEYNSQVGLFLKYAHINIIIKNYISL